MHRGTRLQLIWWAHYSKSGDKYLIAISLDSIKEHFLAGKWQLDPGGHLHRHHTNPYRV
jgi:hypothetical protein